MLQRQVLIFIYKCFTLIVLFGRGKFFWDFFDSDIIEVMLHFEFFFADFGEFLRACF